MAKEEVFFGINIDTGEAIKDFGTLKKRTKELKRELDGTKVGTKRFKELQTEITKNQGTIRRFNRELRETKSLATRVGQGVTTAFKRVGVAMAGAFAVSGIFSVVKNGIKTIADFEQKIADVGAVAGSSSRELDLLAKSARNLGKSSIFTAEQVAGLQLELAKLGFSTSEIIDASGGILDLSTAFRVDLSQAASVTASTLRAFGLDASDTTELTDLMADSFSSTALDISKFEESMKLVAPAAKQTGRSVEDVTALLGLLANNGLSGSIAGTQLNRVFIELNKKGLTLEDAMGKVAESTDKLGTATELVGDRGAKALSIFSDQSEALRVLREDFRDVEGEAGQLAEKSGDTLTGSFKRLNSAYDELILSFSNSKGTLRDITDGLASLINNFTESSSIIDRAESFGLFEDDTVIIDAVEALNAKTTDILSDNQKTLRNLMLEDKRIQDAITKAVSENNKQALINLARDSQKKYKEIRKTNKTELDATGEEATAFFNLYIQSLDEISKAFKGLKEAQEDVFTPTEDSKEDKKSPIDIAKTAAESPEVALARLQTDLLKEQGDKQVANLKSQNDKKKDIETNYAVSQRETNQMVLDSTQQLIGSTIQLLARDEAARKKNGKLIKALAIAQISINLQKQLSDILTVNGSPTNLANLFSFGAAGAVATGIQSALAVVSAATQIATVSSQKFAKGGILSGPSHAQGGIKTNLGELEGGEAVINKKSTAMFSGTLSAINEAGGGKKFARGGVLPTPSTITTPNDINKDILRALTNFNLSPTVSVVEINEAQTRISEIENNSTL
jgi:hypothetical protein